MDRRLFLTVVSGAPAVALVGGCQRTDPDPVTPPPLAALRKLAIDDVEPAITFVPLRRRT